MKKTTMVISIPKHSSQEEINAIRNKYKNQYSVNIVISGNIDHDNIIKNFLKARLEV